MQNFYYSELFIHLSISRFLGLAFTWIPDLGLLFKVQIAKVSNNSSKSFEENMKIKVNISSGGGMHKMIIVQIRNHIDENIILLSPILACWFSPSYITSMLKKVREDHVYDISKSQNNPWISLNKIYAKTCRELCFLEGLDTYAYLDPEFYEFCYGEYEDSEEYYNWGHREHMLGILMKWMADRLKEINAEYKIREIFGYLNDFDKGLYPDSMERTIETIKFIFG